MRHCTPLSVASQLADLFSRNKSTRPIGKRPLSDRSVSKVCVPGNYSTRCGRLRKTSEGVCLSPVGPGATGPIPALASRLFTGGSILSPWHHSRPFRVLSPSGGLVTFKSWGGRGWKVIPSFSLSPSWAFPFPLLPFLPLFWWFCEPWCFCCVNLSPTSFTLRSFIQTRSLPFFQTSSSVANTH
jgi:hypothetical protein